MLRLDHPLVRLRPAAVIAASLLGAAALVAGGVGVAVASGPAMSAAAPEPPDGLGTDPALDELAQACFNGDLLSCDHLYLRSPIGSDYEAYGDSCGGRAESETGVYCALGRPVGDTSLPAVTSPNVSVTTEPSTADVPEPTLDPAELGDDERLSGLAEACYDADMQACDDLYRATQGVTGFEAYMEYADTCAGRQDVGTGRYCVLSFPGTDPSSPVTLPAPTPTTTSTVPPSTEPEITNVPADTEPPVSTEPSASTEAPEHPIPSIVLPTVPTVPFDPLSVPTTTIAGPVGIPEPTIDPDGLGDDEALNLLAAECYDGAMSSCDDLWEQSTPGTEYRSYGDTCAGRQDPDSGNWCADTFSATPDSSDPGDPNAGGPVPDVAGTTSLPTSATGTAGASSSLPEPGATATGLGNSAALDALAQSCYEGDLIACDDLFERAPIGSAYHRYGDTCAERQPVGTFKYCVTAFSDG